MNHAGKKIKQLRQQRGWSQDEVSKKLGISIPAFSKIETGITDLNLSRLDQIAGMFDLTVVQLLSYDEEAATPPHWQELEQIQQRLTEREAEVIDLQRKVIELFEEIRKQRTLV